MPNDDGACWRCRYFEDDPEDGDAGGFCRRCPPTPVFDDGDVLVMVPGVEALDWCGEFVECQAPHGAQTTLLEFQHSTEEMPMEKKNDRGAWTYIAVALLVVATLAVSYAIVSAMVCGFCWAFDLPWSWKMSFGVWLAYLLLCAPLQSSRFKK